MKLQRATTETRCHDCHAPPDEDTVRGAGPLEVWTRVRLAGGEVGRKCLRCQRGAEWRDAIGWRSEPSIAELREEEARRERERPRLVPAAGPLYAPSDARVREAAATLVELAGFAGHPPEAVATFVRRLARPTAALSATVRTDRWGRRYRPILPPPAAVRRDQGASPQAPAPEEG